MLKMQIDKLKSVYRMLNSHNKLLNKLLRMLLLLDKEQKMLLQVLLLLSKMLVRVLI